MPEKPVTPEPVAQVLTESHAGENPSVKPDETDNVVNRRTTNRTTYGPNGERYRNRQSPTLSALEVLPSRREQLTNAGPERQLVWVRNPAQYGDFEDSIADNQERREDFQICKNPDGTPHKRQDVVLCSYPKEIYIEEQEDAIADAIAFDQEIGMTDRKVPLDYSKEDLRELAQRRHDEAMRESRSPTSGMTYHQALSRYSKEQIEAHEAEARSFGESQPFTNEDWKALMREAGGRGANVTIRGGMGAEVTPNSAVGQIRAREKRNAQPAQAAGR